MKFQNISQLFRAQAAKYRGKPVFYERRGEVWETQNWEDFEDAVDDFACALLASGLTDGGKVAILAGNVAEWAIGDLGTIAAGGVGVGIYPTSSAEQCKFIINHSDAEFVVVDTKQQLEKIMRVRLALRQVKTVICLDETALESVEIPVFQQMVFSIGNIGFGWTDKSLNRVVSFKDFLNFGRKKRAEFLPRVEQIGLNAAPDETAIMVYTSGTTGEPKGAMLSHRYILNSCESLRQTIPIFDTDVCFSYLPFCHVAERISGLYNRLYNGTPVYFVDDLAKLGAYLPEVKPTVFASLPRFFEKIYARAVAENGAVRDFFGGRIRLATSGGAPLPNEIADFFARAGLPILQAYGLTENLCVAFNRADDFKFGTVGKPMPMCKVKIAADGEILVKSEMMFSGYYKNAEQTAEMFDTDGWLKTGDLGALDADGFLTITGRKKEIIVLSTGKNVAPALLENLLKENHLISQVFVEGDGHSFLTALVTLNEAETAAFARGRGIEFSNFAELLQNHEVRENIAAQIEKTNARVSSSEQIKRWTILERDFQAELDEVTPTLKLKRTVVANRFADVLREMYE